MKLLIVYVSRDGQTAKIAGRIAEFATRKGVNAEVHDAVNCPGDSIRDCDAVIFGAPVYFGRHPKSAVRFIANHRDQLQKLPAAFCSVSLSGAGKAPRQQENAQRCIREFLDRTAWEPCLCESIAGALLYRKYGFFKQWLMKWVVSREGGDTDTSQDYEYTDWGQVQRFAESFIESIDVQEATAHERTEILAS